jgi:phage repressor protein C with HTH and peptisase S24 domain
MSLINVGSRFEEALEIIYGKKNNRLVANKYNLTQQAIGQLKGKDSINKTISFICEMENINLNWIQTGKGRMFINETNASINIKSHISGDNNTSITGENNKIETIEEFSNQDLVEVNFYPEVYASAGYGSENGHHIDSQKLYLDRSFVNNVLSLNQTKNLDIIKVIGDSMEPFVKNGEQVVVQRDNEARNNEVIIANINGSIYVKRILKDPLGNWVKLISDNDMYPDIELKGEEINYLNIVGIVKAKVKLF